MAERPENWVFLGDSLTEGVGSSRVNYVTELVALLREAESRKPPEQRKSVHEIRLRNVDPDGFNPFIHFNVAGFLDRDEPAVAGSLWIWNLACEGRTIENDLEWLPLIDNLRPQNVFILRGGLESIIRPRTFHDGTWPWWVPKSWQGYAAMDPRCYYSTTWWRRAKQVFVNNIKQRVRLRLLAEHGGAPLLDDCAMEDHFKALLKPVSGVSGQVWLLGLLPVSGVTFPGSPAQFEKINDMLANLAEANHATFIDPNASSSHRLDDPSIYYLDRFHLNESGAHRFAIFLADSLNVWR